MTKASETMASTRSGSWVVQQGGPEGYSAFLPAPLPPDPPVVMGAELNRLHEAASYALGKLEGVSSQLDPGRLLYMYVRKEAVLSSQIEGTQSTLTDLLEFENGHAPGTPVGDVEEVSRYVKALLYATDEIQRGGLPLSTRLLRDTHRILLDEGRGSDQDPGELRRTQNWIGGTRPGNALFVPPPPQELPGALSNIERFIHDEFGRIPPLLKAGLTHAQFETVHPFLDGNGRIGRLLINLILVQEGVLSQPFFYLSLYFRERRGDYYESLQAIRTHGAWEEWMRFFLIGVEYVAQQAAGTAKALLTLFERDGGRVRALGRAAASTLEVYELLRQKVIVAPSRAAKEVGLAFPTVNRALHRLMEMGVVREITGRKRGRLFVYDEQLRILDAGAVPK
jgi:Fic family protein